MSRGLGDVYKRQVVLGMMDSVVIGMIYYAKRIKINPLLATGIAEFVLPFFWCNNCFVFFGACCIQYT